MNDISPKEAIANLNHLYGMVSPDIQRSLDVAIKALERPTGDLISREALIREIGRTDEWYKGRSICNIIDNAPAVEERPQNKWVKIFENPFTNGYVCPFCGHKIQVTEKFLPEVTECESCGADMRGGAE